MRDPVMMAPSRYTAGPSSRIGNGVVGASFELVPTTLNQRNVRILGLGDYEAAPLQRSLDRLLRRREQYPFERVVLDVFPLEEVENVLAEQSRGHITRAALRQ